MRKRPRLRSDSRGKGRIVGVLALAGVILFLGLHFFPNDGGRRTGGPSQQRNTTGEALLDNRGIIYDRNYKELALTLEKVSVYADVRDVDADKAAALLAPVLGVEEQELVGIIEKEHYRAWLAKNISQEAEEEIDAMTLQGIHLHKERIRYYPQKATAAHVVGYVGKSMGLAGVEHRYNTLLRTYGSDDGPILLEATDAEPVEGLGRYLVLSLDIKIQKKLERLTEELGRSREGSHVGALLMEAASGKIIGQAVYPSFDPNSFKEYSWKDLENIFAREIPVPPVLRKLFWDASLIQSHLESSKAALPWSIHSPVRSLGSQLRLWDRLGLNDPLNVDFVKAQEVSSRPESKMSQRQRDYYDSVIKNATPLHVVSAVTALLMGGGLPRPHVIDKLSAGDGRVFEATTGEQVPAVSPLAAAEIRRLVQTQMRKGPLASGSLETGFLSFVETGRERRYLDNRMYISAIPMEQPEFMLFVFAQLPPFSPVRAETKGSFSIAETAQKATISMVAMEKVMSTLSDMMTAEEKNEMNFQLQERSDSAVTVAGVTRSDILGDMPDLRGYSLRKSLRHLKDLRMEIQISGTGVVVNQRPEAGTQVRPGDFCRLVLKPH